MNWYSRGYSAIAVVLYLGIGVLAPLLDSLLLHEDDGHAAIHLESADLAGCHGTDAALHSPPPAQSAAGSLVGSIAFSDLPCAILGPTSDNRGAQLLWTSGSNSPRAPPPTI